MRNMKNKMAIVALIIIVVFVGLFFLYKRQPAGGKISDFGKYQGYSEAIYDGNERRSDYLKLSDGTRLAYDLYLPTDKGVPADKPLPPFSPGQRLFLNKCQPRWIATRMEHYLPRPEKSALA
ncbi:MAG: hypothetical protein FJ115_17860 [Deltaproteobacteria bacterium]|nr:hypothetical protein [Deltaproteobacteria bacterium]